MYGNDWRWFIGVLICPSLVNDWSESWHAQVLQKITQSPDTPATDSWKIYMPRVRIEPGPFDLKSSTLPRRCKTGLYRKAVQVYYIPNQYHVTHPMIIRVRICQWLAMIYWSLDMPKSCEWLIGQSWYAQRLANDWLCLDLSKSCEWLIEVRTCQCLANDLLGIWYSQVLRMIDRSLDMLWFCEWLIRVLNYLEAKSTLSQYFLFSSFFFTLIYDYTITWSNISCFSSFFHTNIWLYYNSIII